MQLQSKATLSIQIRISLPSLAMFLLKTWRSTAFGVYGYLNFTKSGFLAHSKNFNPEDMAQRIDGKNCVVTGANSGIGYATAHGLASRGATVYMVCRNEERGKDAVFKIQSSTGNQNVHLEVCDLSSVRDIKSFYSRFKEKDIPVHVLVNNAGILENTRVTTSEGYELSFAVNVLGTYGMTELMLPLLEKSQPDARVITVASGGMYTSPLTTDLQVLRFIDLGLKARRQMVVEMRFFTRSHIDLGIIAYLPVIIAYLPKVEFDSGKFNGVEQYARNKRIQVALTEKWAEKYGGKGIGFYSMHPGWAETPGVAKSLPSFSKSFEGKLRTSEEGADTVIWLALQPKEKLVSGGFYFDRAEAPKHLPLAGTRCSHSVIDSIADTLNSFL